MGFGNLARRSPPKRPRNKTATMLDLVRIGVIEAVGINAFLN